MNDDYDTPWKDALTRYFSEFVAFYFPRTHEQIDWSVPYVPLEQELAQVTRDAELGCRRVDKLMRVALAGGGSRYVFIHVDVQGHFDRHFAERVFVYNYRIYDRYRSPVSSLIVLADGNPHWKPDSFGYELFDCEMRIRFPSVKLHDYKPRLQQLLRDENVFALVTATHLLTQQTRGRHVKRHAAKWFLVRELYRRKLDKQRIIDLLNFIDWMMQIPEPLQKQLRRDIANLERENAVAYINSFERAGIEQGRQEGRQEGKQEALREFVGKLLVRRFGQLPSPVQERLSHATPAQLEAWGEAVVDATSLEGIFHQS